MKWRKACLKSLADLCLGKMLDQKKNRGEMLPYLANVDVRWGEFDLADLRQMRFESHEMDRYGLKFGDIVMCEGGEPGRCALWKDQIPGLMIQKAIHRIRSNDGLDNRFLYYTFLHKGRTGGFQHLFTGATIKHLPGQNLAKLEIDFPDLPVQSRIASILSAYDDAIENNRRRMELLEKAARLLYDEWFVRLRFPGHEHTPISNGLPKGWELTSLGAIVDIAKGKNITKETTEAGTVPVVAGGLDAAYYHNVANVTAPVVTVSASGANAGYVNIYTEDIWASDCSYISATVTEYVYYFFNLMKSRQKEIFGLQKGAAQPHVYPKDLKRLEILHPPQRLIALFIDLVAPSYALIANLGRQNQKLRAARDLLLPRLMSGEIAV